MKKMISNNLTAKKPQNKIAIANTTLNAAVAVWVLAAVIGQWIFAYYIVYFYGGSAAKGDLGSWNKILFYGLIEGDIAGNLFLAMHLFLAFVITVGGLLQFVPKLRTRFRFFHRWNGRVYILTAFLISIAGLYLNFTRGNADGIPMIVGNRLNASMIMIFAVMAFRSARARSFVSHRRWALRTFLVVSGVWFIRIGYGLWFFLIGAGFIDSIENSIGPFKIFLAFAHTLLPLVILEVYLRTRDRAGSLGRFAMAAGLIVVTAAMGAGIFMAAKIFWLPNL